MNFEQNLFAVALLLRGYSHLLNQSESGTIRPYIFLQCLTQHHFIRIGAFTYYNAMQFY